MAPKFLAWFTSFTWRSPKCSFGRSFSRMSSTYFGNCPHGVAGIPSIVCFLRYFWMLDSIISTYKWNETSLTNHYIKKPKTLSLFLFAKPCLSSSFNWWRGTKISISQPSKALLTRIFSPKHNILLLYFNIQWPRRLEVRVLRLR